MDTADEIARPAGLHPSVVVATTFNLAVFYRNPEPHQPVVVYIEGDGLAWASYSTPSSDPTPRNPVGLRLAARDRSVNVLYIARPCQYVWSSSCRTDYWTGKCFAEEVVSDISTAIDRLTLPDQKVHLVGYSGGGAIATLLAERLSNVVTLRTVAGNLDHDAVNRYHGVSLMPESLNPKANASRLRGLPQVHFVGMKDSVIPPFLVENFARLVGDDSCVKVFRINAASHAQGWEDVWHCLLFRLASLWNLIAVVTASGKIVLAFGPC